MNTIELLYIFACLLVPNRILLFQSSTSFARGLSKLELNGQRGTVLPLESPEQASGHR